jgi:hypothetical protein
MKNISRKNLFISLGAFLVLAMVFLFYYGIPAYTRYRMQNMPHMKVILEINISRFLQSHAKNNDEVLSSIMEEVSRELRLKSNRDVFDVLQEKFSEKQIQLNRYFGSIRDSEDDILALLAIDWINTVCLSHQFRNEITGG